MGIPQVEEEIAAELEQERALKIPTTKEELRKWGRENLGVGPTAAVIREDGPLAGKDLTDPAQAAEVRAILTDVKNASRSATVPVKVDTYLEQDVFKGLPEAPATPQPKARPKPKVDTQPVEVTKQDEAAIEEAFPAAPVTPKPEIKAASVTPPVAARRMTAESLLADQQVAASAAPAPTLSAQQIQNVLENEDYDFRPELDTVAKAKSWAKKNDYTGPGLIVRGDEDVTVVFLDEAKGLKGTSKYKQKKFNDGVEAATLAEFTGREVEAQALREEAQTDEIERPSTRPAESVFEEETLEDRQMMRELGYELKTSAYKGKAFSSELIDIARKGNFRQLLTRLTPSQSPEIKRVLRKISGLGLTTKLVVAPVEVDQNSFYDPVTDTITLDPSKGLTEHAFLHEATHAAIAQALNDKNNPLTKEFLTSTLRFTPI